jgi:two-component system sensor histidine kinase CpxA
MFFEIRPWLWGGLAVLALSLAFWTPFVWGITRYIRRLTVAADRIAAGQFKISLPSRGNDELGNLGDAIETMAGRLDHLVTGQKRFLGDAAHELCAPLARLRTGLGILEMKLEEEEHSHLASIESDAQELATLVEEILAFSRAGNRKPRLQPVLIRELVTEVLAREAGGRQIDIKISPELTAMADPALLARAVGNLVRNALIHAGPDARIAIEAAGNGEFTEITVSDDGPGVSDDELSRLFEPFYRPDRSRSRETGGSGLGLSIVRTAMEACGGEAIAFVPQGGGFSVMLRLRGHDSRNDV